MRTIYKGHPADVWEISKTNEQPTWVKEAFLKNYLFWSDNRLRILMTALNPSAKENLKIGAISTIGG